MQLPPETRGLVNGMIGLSTRSKKDTSQWQCVGCRFECGLTADGTTPAHESVWYLAHIRTAVALSHGNYGIPGMHCDLIDQGHQIGRHRTARLMRENQLIARQKRRFKRMTDSEHAWPTAPNLMAQDFTADGPDRKWGADIS